MHDMHADLDTEAVDHAIAALAARQFGVVTRAQLATVGLQRGAIAHRLAVGRLHRLHSGVFAVGHRSPRREARWLAAVLACGPGAVLSHRSAASLWRIRDGESLRPDVTVPGSNGRGHPGITIHRSQLPPQDVTVEAGIPVTSPTRTVFDLERELTGDELVRAFRQAAVPGPLRSVRRARAPRPPPLAGTASPDQGPEDDPVRARGPHAGPLRPLQAPTPP
jgi:hypothetical protein